MLKGVEEGGSMRRDPVKTGWLSQHSIPRLTYRLMNVWAHVTGKI